jgi:putative ABC transport system permease protein
MRFIDLLRLVTGNLSRRKGRVALTTIGVVIGTAAVVILVSLAIGLQKSANEQLYGIGDLTQIQVFPAYEEMAAPGGGGAESKGPLKQPKMLTTRALKDLQAIPGVTAVIPREFMMAPLMLKLDRLEGGGNIIGVGLNDLTELGLVAAQGDLRLDKGSIIVGSMAASNFYDPKMRPGQPPPPPPELYNEHISFVLIKYDQEGKEIKKTLNYRVVGVLEETRGESDWSIYMRLDELKAINEWAQGRRINYNKDGYSQVLVQVDSAENVLTVTDQINELGFQAFSPQSFLQGINSFYLALQIIFGGVGAIALLVAAIGIANTMTMAILERTREIGLMKAVGATNKDVLSIFLGEAAGIGFLGGLGGALAGWLGGRALNVIALAFFAAQSSEMGGLPPSSVAYTPLWLPLFAMAFATLVGLISGLYPSLRAATMVPVAALKYE